ncbi:hypothetical protein BX600DRAFT_530457 [Xylariales sp. PMI_506]|nr:hypothetical protein BX600DRAFT_530457 [Xylariales sp. PMI_506]
MAILLGVLISEKASSILPGIAERIERTPLPFSLSLSSRPSSHIPTQSYKCDLEYTIEILSFDPLVFYVNNFISEDEIKHVLEVSQDSWYAACVAYSEDGVASAQRAPDKFEAEVAALPPSDPVAKCLSSRMISLLGNVQHEATEPIRLVKYTSGDRFRLHTDRYAMAVKPGATDVLYGLDYGGYPHNRLLSSMVYLEDDCVGGETYFPDVPGVGHRADGSKFSRGETGGLLVKPRRGNAVFWNNFHLNGTGDDRLFHASLPIKSGVKTYELTSNTTRLD